LIAIKIIHWSHLSVDKKNLVKVILKYVKVCNKFRFILVYLESLILEIENFAEYFWIFIADFTDNSGMVKGIALWWVWMLMGCGQGCSQNLIEGIFWILFSMDGKIYGGLRFSSRKIPEIWIKLSSRGEFWPPKFLSMPWMLLFWRNLVRRVYLRVSLPTLPLPLT